MSLAEPSADSQALVGLPSQRWDVQQPLYRLHDAARAPQWFAADPDTGRFAPPPGLGGQTASYGVCYFATHPVGAFLETLGRVNPLLQSIVDTKVIPTCYPSSDVFLADLTDNRWRSAFPGLTAAVGVGDDYVLPQRWGQRIQQAGYAGILHPAAHDLALEQRSVALFGKPGLDENAFSSSASPLSDDVLDRVTELGWTILPSAPLAY